MLTLVESKNDKLELHKQLEKDLEKAWVRRERRRMSWRTGNRDIEILHNGKYWFASDRLTDDVTYARFWDPYGLYKPVGVLRITVEVNVPTGENTATVAGLFATDPLTGIAYLLHDGSVGGGKKGFGKFGFLAWSGARLVEVKDSKGRIRLAIIVAPLNYPSTAEGIERFIQTVADFKDAVDNGEASTPEALKAQNTYKEYFDEFSGVKRRGPLGAIDYFSHHGDVVKALHQWRGQNRSSDETLVKNVFIDLGVTLAGKLVEVYEVKTTCDRQTLYTALGQIAVHGQIDEGNCKGFIVLPHGKMMPADLARAVERGGVTILRFEVKGGQVRILG